MVTEHWPYIAGVACDDADLKVKEQRPRPYSGTKYMFAANLSVQSRHGRLQLLFVLAIINLVIVPEIDGERKPLFGPSFPPPIIIAAAFCKVQCKTTHDEASGRSGGAED